MNVIKSNASRKSDQTDSTHAAHTGEDEPAKIAVTVPTEHVHGSIKFSAPVRLKSAGNYIKTQAPGYACPAFVDIDQDGQKDLLVGQQAKGKIGVFKRDGKEFAAGTFLKIKNTQRLAMVKDVW